MASALAQDGTGGFFSFFGGQDIDYWGEGRHVYDPLKPQATQGIDGGTNAFSGATIIRAGDAASFSWSAYQDARSPEFWDDGGDWVPPRPFREAAAEPTAANVDQYLAWQGRKAEVMGKFQAALGARGAVMLHAKLPADSSDSVPWRRVKVAYFYQTACPHCRASKDVIEAVQREGAAVTFIQLDAKSSPPLHQPSIPYGPDWEETFHIASTPTWVLSFAGKTAKHVGAMSFAEVDALAQTLTQEETHHASSP